MLPRTLKELVGFTKFFHSFQGIIRTIYVNGQDRKENNAEHSFQLALTAWFIADTKKLKLDKSLLIKYALIHDLAETYAGDPYFYSKDMTKDFRKKKEEQKAVKRMKKEFGEFKDYFKLIKKYDLRKDKESRFIYSLDKILPILNELINEGKSFKEYKLSLGELIDGKKDKVKTSKEAKIYYDMIMDILIQNEERFFLTKIIK